MQRKIERKKKSMIERKYGEKDRIMKKRKENMEEQRKKRETNKQT